MMKINPGSHRCHIFSLNLTLPRNEVKKPLSPMRSAIMSTGTDHIGMTFRCYQHDDLVFGRAGDDGLIAFLNADIRLGRTADQKRRLALAIMHEISTRWSLPKEHIYVVYTEHDGPDFQLSDRVLPSWQAGEDPLND
jgi:hypothetical protein